MDPAYRYRARVSLRQIAPTSAGLNGPRIRLGNAVVSRDRDRRSQAMRRTNRTHLIVGEFRPWMAGDFHECISFKWCRQGILNRPSRTINTRPDSRGMNLRSAGEFNDRDTVERGHTIAIQHLLLTCRPTAILRRIPERVIDAINGMFRARRRTHISEERLERRAPARADGDAPAAVASIPAVLRIAAALDHSGPAFVLARFGPTVCDSIFSGNASGGSGLRASATPRLASLQDARGGARRAAAVTLAQPIFSAAGDTRRWSNRANHGESAESSASQIDKAARSHLWILTVVRRW